jgi:hypothetical protein
MDVLASSSSRVACALVVQRLAHAIRVGAPLYNQGAVQLCIDLYERAIRLCLHHAGSTPAVLNHLQDALNDSRNYTSASRKAWVLKAGMDRAVYDAVVISTASRSPTTIMAHETPSTVSAMGWTSSCREPPVLKPAAAPPEECLISRLSDDLVTAILRHMPSHLLCTFSMTCQSLRDHVHSHTIGRVQQGAMFRMCVNELAPSLWLRALVVRADLEAHVGPRPASHSWWSEWAQMMISEGVHTGKKVREWIVRKSKRTRAPPVRR